MRNRSPLRSRIGVCDRTAAATRPTLSRAVIQAFGPPPTPDDLAPFMHSNGMCIETSNPRTSPRLERTPSAEVSIRLGRKELVGEESQEWIRWMRSHLFAGKRDLRIHFVDLERGDTALLCALLHLAHVLKRRGNRLCIRATPEWGRQLRLSSMGFLLECPQTAPLDLPAVAPQWGSDPNP